MPIAPPTAPAIPAGQHAVPFTTPALPRRRGHTGLALGLSAATVAILIVTLGVTYYFWPKKASSLNAVAPPLPTSAQTSLTSPSTSQAGTQRQQQVLPFPGLKHPSGVAVDSAGNVYVLDADHDEVLKLPPGAAEPIPVRIRGIKNPFGLAVDGHQQVYLTDAVHNGRVLLVEPWGSAGTHIQELPIATAYGNSLSKPSGLAVDSSGSVYIADAGNNKVEKLIPPYGDLVPVPFSGLSQPEGVVIDASGNVYVADQDNNRVLKLTNGSSTQTELPFKDLNKPSGLAVDSSGNVYVTDSDNRVVELPSGSSNQTVLPFKDLKSASGLAVDSAGYVYVADETNNQVLKLSPAS